MIATIKIECESYDDLQAHLSEIKNELKRKKKVICAEEEQEIRIEDSNCYGSHEVELTVFNLFALPR